MKTKNRLFKAAAVIVILGIGIFNNMDNSIITRGIETQLVANNSQPVDDNSDKDTQVSNKAIVSNIIFTALKYFVLNR